jgi:hypothetical protein
MPIGRFLPPGSLSNFSRNSKGQAYGLNWDNDSQIPLVIRPFEGLASSASPKLSVLTGVDEVLDWFTIPAGTLGPKSILQIDPCWTFTNSANAKLLKVMIGTATVYSVSRTASVREAPMIVLANRNSLTSQIMPYDNGYAVASLVPSTSFTIDFGVNNTVAFIGQRANAADTLTLEFYRVMHLVGD